MNNPWQAVPLINRAIAFLEDEDARIGKGGEISNHQRIKRATMEGLIRDLRWLAKELREKEEE